MSQPEDQHERSGTDFAEQAEETPPGFFAEFWDFLIHNKRWWITPIVIVLLLLGLAVVFSSSSPVAPFIYTFW